MSRPMPYIGITGACSGFMMSTANAIVETPRSGRRLHFGVMMSYKTLKGLPTKWSRVFPQKEKVASIFHSENPLFRCWDLNVMRCLHFADYDDHADLEGTLLSAIDYGGRMVNSLQLDMIWPNPDAVSRAVQRSNRRIDVVLQIGENAFQICNNDPQEIVERLKRYSGVIQYVLLDKSMGRGIGMDAHALIPFATEIQEQFPEIGIAAAGGLGPRSINLVKPLLDVVPDLSIDAQGQISEQQDSLRPIDWSEALLYLSEASALFYRHRSHI